MRVRLIGRKEHYPRERRARKPKGEKETQPKRKEEYRRGGRPKEGKGMGTAIEKCRVAGGF